MPVQDLKTVLACSLVKRFLDGVKEGNAKFKIKYHKEPEDIVNYLQTKHRNQTNIYLDKIFKRYARRASTENDVCDITVGQTADEEDDDEAERIMRLPLKDKQNKRKYQGRLEGSRRNGNPLN